MGSFFLGGTSWSLDESGGSDRWRSMGTDWSWNGFFSACESSSQASDPGAGWPSAGGSRSRNDPSDRPRVLSPNTRLSPDIRRRCGEWGLSLDAMRAFCRIPVDCQYGLLRRMDAHPPHHASGWVVQTVRNELKKAQSTPQEAATLLPNSP